MRRVELENRSSEAEGGLHEAAEHAEGLVSTRGGGELAEGAHDAPGGRGLAGLGGADGAGRAAELGAVGAPRRRGFAGREELEVVPRHGSIGYHVRESP